MMFESPITSSNLRVWDTTEDGKEKYLPYVVVSDLRNSDGKSIIRIIERITVVCFLNHFEDNCTLSIVEGAIADPTVFLQDDIILQFRNCVLADSAITNLGAMSYDDVGALDMQAHIDCDAFGRFNKKDFVPFDSQRSIKPCVSCDQLYNHLRFLGGCPSCGSPQE